MTLQTESSSLRKYVRVEASSILAVSTPASMCVHLCVHTYVVICVCVCLCVCMSVCVRACVLHEKWCGALETTLTV